jgi:hypothetical protein
MADLYLGSKRLWVPWDLLLQEIGTPISIAGLPMHHLPTARRIDLTVLENFQDHTVLGTTINTIQAIPTAQKHNMEALLGDQKCQLSQSFGMFKPGGTHG